MKGSGTHLRQKIIWGGLSLVFLVSTYLIVVLGVWFYYSGCIYPGVTVAGTSLVGKSDAEAKKVLENKAKEYLESEGVWLKSYDISYNYEDTIAEAKKAIASPFSLGRKINIPLRFSFDKKALYKDLAVTDDKHREIVRSAEIVEKSNTLEVKEGTIGSRVLYGENTYRFKSAVGNLTNGFTFQATNIKPNLSKAELEKELENIKEIAGNGLKLIYGKTEYILKPAEVASWANVASYGEVSGRTMQKEYWHVLFANTESGGVLFAVDKIESYLAVIAKKIDRTPINATLTMKNGKVDVFSLSRSGLELDLSASSENIINALSERSQTADLAVREIEPEISKNSLNSLGIVELIAQGRSNFAGSPNNRRHNIRVGASKFNGVLIESGDTFSFTSTLGQVDASTGYLPELVIKDNETVPEYGGGLCQVSSTAFRAALNAGLPIIARKAHSYPVLYYKPYGTDATVYVPNPDLKFNNDTGKYILIQTRIEGNYLYFDFYGTKKKETVRFAGNSKANGAVSIVENITPYIYDYGVRGRGSFTAVIWRFRYDSKGKLLEAEDFVSKYDSPDKYPH